MESSEAVTENLIKANQALQDEKRELHEARVYLDCVLENVKDIVFRTNPDGVVISFNNGGESALGYSWSELSGRKMRELAADATAFDRLTDACRKEGMSESDDFYFRHKSGGAVPCRVTFTCLKNPDNAFMGIVGVCRDMTAWKKFREDLIRVDRLAEVGRIASGIVHELNNPVAVIGEISGWIGAVAGDAKGLNEEDRQEISTSVRHIGEQTRRCRGITQQLLSFVRNDKISTTSLDAHELLKETVELLTPELKFKDVEILYNFIEKPVIINSDKQLLQQVFVNFISNAVYAVNAKADKKGRITLETVLDGTDGKEMVEIRISDTGIGISPDHQKEIYEYFFTTKPAGKGTGLGLPISRDIIQQLGGALSFESALGQGTTFTVRLPVS